jgi:acylphosphatase
MVKHLKLKIYGRVQGVGFRWCAYEKFVELGLVGKAENREDGTVEIFAEGEEEILQQLINWAEKGPDGAKVEKLETEELKEPFVPLKTS